MIASPPIGQQGLTPRNASAKMGANSVVRCSRVILHTITYRRKVVLQGILIYTPHHTRGVARISFHVSFLMTRLRKDKLLAALYCIAGSVIGVLVCGAVIWAPRASRQPNLAAAHRHPTQLHQFPMQSYNGNA
jgi:hypothetical protein